MKIGMLVTSFPVAAQPFVLNQVIGLVAQGAEVEVVSRNDTRHEAYHQDFDDYGLSERTTYLGQPQGLRTRLRYCWQQRVCWRAIGVKRLFAALDVWRYGRDAGSLRLLVLLLELHDREWDVVLVQYGVNGYIGRFLRDVGIARKFVLQIRGSVFATTEKAYRVRTVLRSADEVITISQALQDLVVSKGAVPERSRVLYTGLRVDRFPFRPEWRLGRDPLKLLAVGRLVPVKGHEVLIRAVAFLVEQGVNVTCTIVGGGPRRDALLALAQKLGVAERLVLIDLIPQHELIGIYHGHDLLVHPSVVVANGKLTTKNTKDIKPGFLVGCFEGMGTAITEAQACGLPVLASDHGGMLDTVKDEVTGFLFRTGDAAALADRVVTIMEQADRVEPVRVQARAMIEQEHDCWKQAAKLATEMGKW